MPRLMMADYLLRAIDGQLLLANFDDNIESECKTSEDNRNIGMALTEPLEIDLGFHD